MTEEQMNEIRRNQDKLMLKALMNNPDLQKALYKNDLIRKELDRLIGENGDK